MNVNDILKYVDHTLLKSDASWDDIKIICDDAIKYNCASVCIGQSFVKRAKEYCGDKMQVCTVVGFPCGNMPSEVKLFETKLALENGADEIDMVINIGDLKDKKYDDILNEIKMLKNACGNKILKVIIETCLLTYDEKVKMCEIVSNSGADFIKTSSGFSTGGATFDDVKLFSENVKNGLKIKAAGGIKTLEDAKNFIKLGATRLGTSKVVSIVKEM